MSKTITPEEAARMKAERQARRAQLAAEEPVGYPPGPASETVPRVDEDRYASPPDDAAGDDDGHHEATGAASAPANPLSLAARRESVLAHLRRRRSGVDRAIETPWPDLNNQLGGGWWPGVHVLIAGTGAGKSQLVIEAGTDAAAEDRAAVGYVALELDDVGMLSRIASRLAARDKPLSWSAISRGEVDPDGEDMVRAWQRMDHLPFHLDTGSGYGWSVDNLKTMADGLRAAYPDKPLLLVVDFLQLIGGDGRDNRERVGKASYAARQIAREHQAAIVLISSTARQNYNLFGDGGFTTAGIQIDGGRVILSPDVLVGLGKETGEIEYAADSVTVMGRIPRDRIPADPGGFSPVLLATAKLRAGPPSWCVLDSNGQTFRAAKEERAAEVVDALQVKGKKGGEAAGQKGGQPRSSPSTREDDGPEYRGD